MLVGAGGTYKIVPATRLSLNRQFAALNNSLLVRYLVAIVSRVSLPWSTICPQPVGGWHELLILVNVAAEVNVEISNIGPVVKVTVTGDGKRESVMVGGAEGTNSTSEMDNAPRINPIETKATTAAFPKSRSPFVIYFP